MSGSYVSLVAVLGISGCFVAGTAVTIMALSLLRPPRMTDGKAVWLLRRLSPGDLDMAFEEVSFFVRDGDGSELRLAAWWIPSPAGGGRCVVLIHGYADAKVGAIAWAPVWQSLGFHILAIDLRAHGESGGECCTAGVDERHDIGQVLDQLRAERPQETDRLILFGVSMGAAVAAAAANAAGNVAAVVMESPYADFQRAARISMDRAGAPGGIFQSLSLRLAARIAGVDFDDVGPVRQIQRLSCPVMVIQPEDDPGVDAPDREAIAGSVRSRHNPADVIWPVADTGHLLALQRDPKEYRARVAAFVDGLNLAATDIHVGRALPATEVSAGNAGPT